MTAFEIIPFILFLVVIGTAIAERINVPYPLVLVFTGLIIGSIPGIPNWHPPSVIVLVLFLPPILFSAARLISWEEIQNNLPEIISLSFLLVILTTFAIAWILYEIVPNMPFSAALVLGAIISPTDAIASTSILTKLNAEQHLVRSLEIESLFNDAISIVLYYLAVSFVYMGTINIPQIAFSTITNALGGIAVGLMFAYFTSLIVREFLTDSENELPIIMSLILAYVSYLFADRIGVSSVLAVVSAGLFHKKTERTIKSKTRLAEKSVWGTLIFFLNGLIFIIIGMQFPAYLQKISYFPASQLVLFSTVTIATLILLRFIWVTFTSAISSLLARLFKRTIKPGDEFSWREVLISSWAGMRGLVSLALAIALPLSLTPSKLFPNRDLIIFLTIVTILFTLVIQGLTLPYLIKLLKIEKNNIATLKRVTRFYRQLTKQAIHQVKHLSTHDDTCSLAAKKLVDNYYKNRLLRFKVPSESESDTQEVIRAAEKLLAKMLEYERSLLHKMRTEGEISEEIYTRILSKIDRDEVGFAAYN